MATIIRDLRSVSSLAREGRDTEASFLTPECSKGVGHPDPVVIT